MILHSNIFPLRIQFNNPVGCIVDYHLLERSIFWISEKTLKRQRVTPTRTIFLNASGYPIVSIGRRKYQVHRLIMMFIIGKWLDRRIHVHHEDRNILNARVSNLQFKNEFQHLSDHHLGRQFSPEHRMKIAASNRRRKGIRVGYRIEIKKQDIMDLISGSLMLKDLEKKYHCSNIPIKQRMRDLGVYKDLRSNRAISDPLLFKIH